MWRIKSNRNENTDVHNFKIHNPYFSSDIKLLFFHYFLYWLLRTIFSVPDLRFWIIRGMKIENICQKLWKFLYYSYHGIFLVKILKFWVAPNWPSVILPHKSEKLINDHVWIWHVFYIYFNLITGEILFDLFQYYGLIFVIYNWLDNIWPVFCK